MTISTQQIDIFIDTAIDRLSGEDGTMRSRFYVDLREFQQRITQKLVDQCIEACRARGLLASRQGDGLSVVVDLNACHFNSRQAAAYRTALAYTRQVHGNDL